VEGVVSGVDNATRTDRKGSLTLSFDRMRLNGRNHRIRASATQVFEAGGVRAEAPTAGVGAGVGGIVGGIIGGVKGAVIGAAIGAGGAIAATEGKDVNLPAGSILRIRMDSPVQVG
jgi:outer membrane lipoprotein SlyB